MQIQISKNFNTFIHKIDLSQQQKELLNNNMKEHKTIQAPDSKIVTLFGLMQPQLKSTLKQNFGNNDVQYIVQNTTLSGQINEAQRQRMAKQNQKYNAEWMIKFTLLNCQFTNLITLRLARSQIATIEFIGFMDAVNLKNLYLGSNFITNFNPLKKTNFRHLLSINIEGNPSRSIKNLQRIEFSHILLNVHFEPRQDYDVMMEDISQLLKFQCNIIHFLLIKSRKRIRQKSLYQQLKQKFMITNTRGKLKIFIFLFNNKFDSL